MSTSKTVLCAWINQINKFKHQNAVKRIKLSPELNME